MLDDHDPPTAGHAAMASGANGAATLSTPHHLLLVNDDGGLILVDQVIDFELPNGWRVWSIRKLAKQGSLL